MKCKIKLHRTTVDKILALPAADLEDIVADIAAMTAQYERVNRLAGRPSIEWQVEVVG